MISLIWKRRLMCFNWFHHHTTGQPKPYFFSLFFSKLQAIFPVLKKWLKDSCFGMKYAENFVNKIIALQNSISQK